MINNIMEKYGKIDIVVNNAGIVRDGFLMLMSEKDWNDVISINLNGVFNCSKKAVSEPMISQRSGLIINIALSKRNYRLAWSGNYSAAKGVVIAFTKALSKPNLLLLI